MDIHSAWIDVRAGALLGLGEAPGPSMEEGNTMGGIGRGSRGLRLGSGIIRHADLRPSGSTLTDGTNIAFAFGIQTA